MTTNSKVDVLKTDEAVTAYINNVFDNQSTLPDSDDNTKFSIGWCRQAEIDLSPREYQREKVADYTWKCNLIKTLLVHTHYKIPSIHFRIFRNDKEARDVIGYEVVDGQQRLSAVLDFIGNKFSLPEDFPKVSGNCDVAGRNFKEICSEYPLLRSRILDYGLSITLYDNFTDDQVSELFVEVLNNTNDLTPQEKRNAIRSALAFYVRNTARLNPHELFSRVVEKPNTKDERTYWKYFSKKFKLGRMEGDEWLAELIYLFLKGMSVGVSQSKLTDFYKDTAVTANGPNDWNFKDKLQTLVFSKLDDDINSLLSSAVEIIKAAGDDNRCRFNRVFSLFAVLFANEMKVKYNCTQIDYKKYVTQLMKTYDKWLEPKVYLGKLQADNSTDMGPFSKLFGGKNANVFRTAYSIVVGEMKVPNDWGFVELDPRKSFSKNDIDRRLAKNGGVCDYTGDLLPRADAVGDHDIPRSWGVGLGGVTEYDNLKVTTKYHNQQKLNMCGDDYLEKLGKFAQAKAQSRKALEYAV
jgi:hypothetical protein